MLSQIHILTYIDVENDGKDPKPKDGYHVRISKSGLFSQITMH